MKDILDAEDIEDRGGDEVSLRLLYNCTLRTHKHFDLPAAGLNVRGLIPLSGIGECGWINVQCILASTVKTSNDTPGRMKQLPRQSCEFLIPDKSGSPHHSTTREKHLQKQHIPIPYHPSFSPLPTHSITKHYRPKRDPKSRNYIEHPKILTLDP